MTKAFTSTSLFRDTTYDAEVELTILLPERQNDSEYDILKTQILTARYL